MGNAGSSGRRSSSSRHRSSSKGGGVSSSASTDSDDIDDTTNGGDMTEMEQAKVVAAQHLKQASKVVNRSMRDIQANIASGIKNLEENDHPAAQLLDTICSPYLDEQQQGGHRSRSHSRDHHHHSSSGDRNKRTSSGGSGKKGNKSSGGRLYNEDPSDDDDDDDTGIRTVSEDDETANTDYYQQEKTNKSSKNKNDRRQQHHDEPSVGDNSSFVTRESDYDDSTAPPSTNVTGTTPEEDDDDETAPDRRRGKQDKGRRRGGRDSESDDEDDDETFETFDHTSADEEDDDDESSYRNKRKSGSRKDQHAGVVTQVEEIDKTFAVSQKPLASSFAKRCYFTKSGIGKSTQHYEGLTLTGNIVLMLAAAMKLKGCPTICDEDLRRVEQTYPNQFSRLPDELLLSSGWRRISKYCHFSNKPIPDGVPFFHSKQRLHASGGYYFLLAAAVGMVRPIDVEPLSRDTLVLLETDFPHACDAAPTVLVQDPAQWTLVDKFCFFSGGPINTDEDVYYQADFDGNPIYMLAFLSPSLTPGELYKLDGGAGIEGDDDAAIAVFRSVAAVEAVESVYDLSARDFDDLKLYHLGPCRALPQYVLQPQAWTKVLPPHFLAAKQQATLRAQDYENRHGGPPPTTTMMASPSPTPQLSQQQLQQQQYQQGGAYYGNEAGPLPHYPPQHPYEQQPHNMVGPDDHQQHMYDEQQQQHMYEQQQTHHAGGYAGRQSPYLQQQQYGGGQYPAADGYSHQQQMQQQQMHLQQPMMYQGEFQRAVEEEGAFIDTTQVPLDEALASAHHQHNLQGQHHLGQHPHPHHQQHPRMDPPEDDQGEPPRLSVVDNGSTGAGSGLSSSYIPSSATSNPPPNHNNNSDVVDGKGRNDHEYNDDQDNEYSTFEQHPHREEQLNPHHDDGNTDPALLRDMNEYYHSKSDDYDAKAGPRDDRPRDNNNNDDTSYDSQDHAYHDARQQESDGQHLAQGQQNDGGDEEHNGTDEEEEGYGSFPQPEQSQQHHHFDHHRVDDGSFPVATAGVEGGGGGGAVTEGEDADSADPYTPEPPSSTGNDSNFFFPPDAGSPDTGDDSSSGYQQDASDVSPAKQQRRSQISMSPSARGRSSDQLPPTSPRKVSAAAGEVGEPASAYTPTSAMRGAQELLRRNRQRRLELAQQKKKDQGATPANATDEQQPSTENAAQSSSVLPASFDSHDSSSGMGQWDGSNSSVTGGSSVWSEEGSATGDRSSRRALILQMAKSRMKSKQGHHAGGGEGMADHDNTMDKEAGAQYFDDSNTQEEKKYDQQQQQPNGQVGAVLSGDTGTLGSDVLGDLD